MVLRKSKKFLIKKSHGELALYVRPIKHLALTLSASFQTFLFSLIAKYHSFVPNTTRTFLAPVCLLQNEQYFRVIRISHPLNPI